MAKYPNTVQSRPRPSIPGERPPNRAPARRPPGRPTRDTPRRTPPKTYPGLPPAPKAPARPNTKRPPGRFISPRNLLQRYPGGILENLWYLQSLERIYQGDPVVTNMPPGTWQAYWGSDAPDLPWVPVGANWVRTYPPPTPPIPPGPVQNIELGMQAWNDPDILTFPYNSLFNPRYAYWQVYANPHLPINYGWHRATFVFNNAIDVAYPPTVKIAGDLEVVDNWVEIPFVRFRDEPAPRFDWVPSVYPHEQPISAPAPAPKPLDQPRPDPWSPESPEVGPRPTPTPQPKPEPYPDPVPNPDPETPYKPSVVYNPFPDAPLESWLPANPPRPVTRPSPRPQPPKKGEKEIKARMSPVLAAIWNGVGPITEGIDLVNAIYEALPRSVKRAEYNSRGRQPNPAERAAIIYRNINLVDIGSAMGNIAQNQIEDYIIGKFGKGLGEASKNSGRPIGYGAGPAL